MLFRVVEIAEGGCLPVDFAYPFYEVRAGNIMVAACETKADAKYFALQLTGYANSKQSSEIDRYQLALIRIRDLAERAIASDEELDPYKVLEATSELIIP